MEQMTDVEFVARALQLPIEDQRELIRAGIEIAPEQWKGVTLNLTTCIRYNLLDAPDSSPSAASLN